jgi:DNA-binding transcriptional regulator PaaX
MPKMSSDRALVLRRCCEAGRGVGELAHDILDKTYTAARALAARMLKAELLHRSRSDGHFVYSATPLGRARLRKHDRRIESVVASRDVSEGAIT